MRLQVMVHLQMLVTEKGPEGCKQCTSVIHERFQLCNALLRRAVKFRENNIRIPFCLKRVYIHHITFDIHFIQAVVHPADNIIVGKIPVCGMPVQR